MSFAYTANYRYVDIALKARWEPFTTLEREMLAFVPRPNSDFEDERLKLLDHFRQANPNAPIERVTEWVDSQIRARTPAKAQIEAKFEDRFIAEYVNVAMLAHALCEASINGILALGLCQVGSPDLFNLIENAPIKEKWLLGPKTLSPRLDATHWWGDLPHPRSTHEGQECPNTSQDHAGHLGETWRR